MEEHLRWSHLLHSFLHIVHCVGSDQGMQRLIFPGQHLTIFSPYLPLLHRTFPSDHDLGTTFLLDVLQSITAGQTRWGKGEYVTLKMYCLFKCIQQHAPQTMSHPIYRGPMSRPTKLISGYSSWGIITLSLTLVAGGLQETKARIYEQDLQAFSCSWKALLTSKSLSHHTALYYITHHLLSPFQPQQQPVPWYFHNEKFKPPLSDCLIFNTLCFLDRPLKRQQKARLFFCSLVHKKGNCCRY